MRRSFGSWAFSEILLLFSWSKWVCQWVVVMALVHGSQYAGDSVVERTACPSAPCVVPLCAALSGHRITLRLQQDPGGVPCSADFSSRRCVNILACGRWASACSRYLRGRPSVSAVPRPDPRPKAVMTSHRWPGFVSWQGRRRWGPDASQHDRPGGVSLVVPGTPFGLLCRGQPCERGGLCAGWRPGRRPEPESVAGEEKRGRIGERLWWTRERTWLRRVREGTSRAVA